ncbi:MAG: hypothetical protein ABI407_16850 [Bradyrhizobium sp.]
MSSRAHLSRIVAPVVALCSMAAAAGTDAWEFRGADTANHHQYAGFDGFAEPAVSPDVPPMSLKARAGLSADESHPASAAPIERIRKVEN